MSLKNRRRAEERVADHFEEIDERIIDYATNVVLNHSKYVYYSNKDKQGYCTHCQKTFELEEKKKHNSEGICPNCKSVCQFKSKGYGRKYAEDGARFLWFEKSPTDKNIITASWISCERSYVKSFKEVETTCSRVVYYIFEQGRPAMYKPNYVGTFDEMKTVHDVYAFQGSIYALESLEVAAKGTPYQYAGWEEYGDDLIKYLELYSTHPNIEALTKAGLRNIVEIKLRSSRTYHAFNWRAKRLHEFFKVSKNDFKEMRRVAEEREYKHHINGNTIYGPEVAYSTKMWQDARKGREKLKYEELIDFIRSFDLYSYDEWLREIRKYSSLVKILNYIKNQYERNNNDGNFFRRGQVIVTWSDYIKDCRDLGMDVTKKSVLYPKNVHEAHQRTIKLNKAKKDEVLNKKVKKRYEQLKQVEMEGSRLIIKSPKDYNEIIKEGEKLAHCVASRYGREHADGKTTILFVRKKDEPSAPFYTAEIRNGRMTQLYGKRNTRPTEEVQAFVDHFMEQKINNKKAREIV